MVLATSGHCKSDSKLKKHADTQTPLKSAIAVHTSELLQIQTATAACFTFTRFVSLSLFLSLSLSLSLHALACQLRQCHEHESTWAKEMLPCQLDLNNGIQHSRCDLLGEVIDRTRFAKTC
jgi:hypothetical protein